ncbi:hypothetical protein SAPIS_v1c03740 [Spiroplasma apis B31]|uniref:Transmembrane protein n=1 Tax=Spiroplasma apis B31 TaxID=1276258 RepID=V5RK85_SPIAP|nr:hypothetical protein SAPIS_v1c03740 [Spiroplasma apis B31]
MKKYNLNLTLKFILLLGIIFNILVILLLSDLPYIFAIYIFAIGFIWFIQIMFWILIFKRFKLLKVYKNTYIEYKKSLNEVILLLLNLLLWFTLFFMNIKDSYNNYSKVLINRLPVNISLIVYFLIRIKLYEYYKNFELKEIWTYEFNFAIEKNFKDYKNENHSHFLSTYIHFLLLKEIFILRFNIFKGNNIYKYFFTSITKLNNISRGDKFKPSYIN